MNFFKESLTQPLPSLVTLDQCAENFCSKLEDIDNTPSRTADTVFILYVKSGQSSVESFLQNVVSFIILSTHYLFLCHYVYFVMTIG